MVAQTVKHYEVQDPLGRGGMGVVYRGRDSRLGRAVALKFLSEEVVRDPDRRARFMREARAACAVNHPAIAQVYDVDEADGQVFMAMELVEGKTVRALIKGRELDVLGAIEIAAQVAGGLGKAHEAGIVHRDIKPENVIVTPDGHAKILDFGLAKLLDTTGGAGSVDEVSHMETVSRTQAGVVLGTLRYMSPEQARGQAVDHRSDLFSLGVMLYEMVTGQPPFAGQTPLDTLHAIAYEETRPVSTVRANLPPSLQRVVTRCLRKRAADRYPDARELIGELRTVQREVESGVTSKVSLGERLAEQLRGLRDIAPSQWILLGGVALAGIAFAVLFLARSGSDVIPGLIFPALVGLYIWRRIRNRRYRFVKGFVAKVRKMPEVRLVAIDGMRISVIADRAEARTYVRVNALVDAINASMFFGDPFAVAVRDGVAPEEEKALLSGPGVVYVREDASAEGRRSGRFFTRGTE